MRMGKSKDKDSRILNHGSMGIAPRSGRLFPARACRAGVELVFYAQILLAQSHTLVQVAEYSNLYCNVSLF